MSDLIGLSAKVLGIALIPGAFFLLWTAVQLARGDRLAFRQAKEMHPSVWDAVLGRVKSPPGQRADYPMNEGVVLKSKRGKSVWVLNRGMSDEQYNRLTK